MGAGRGRRWNLVVLAALVAAAAAGASPSEVRATRNSNIVFAGGEASVIVLSSGGGSGDQSIEMDFATDTRPLPKAFVIEIPAGYTLDLDAKPGTVVADATIAIVDSPSFGATSGDVIAKDASTFVLDPAGPSCAPGKHAAVWALSTSLAGQPIEMIIFVDPGKTPETSYVLQACLKGLGSSNIRSGASISLRSIEGLVTPTAPGNYRWRALVTPQIRKPYELQALVPLPESVTVTTRYDRGRKRTTVSGTVVEAGKPVLGVPVLVRGQRNSSDLRIWEARTDDRGRYSIQAPTTRTTDFTVSVSPLFGPCAGETTAEGGCLGSMTVPPDDGFATVWISVRGGATRKVRAGDQRRAEQAGLNRLDLPADFESTLGGGDACLNPANESQLTITGESTSPAFYKIDTEEPITIVQAIGLTRVYATAKQARRAFAHQARRSTLRCVIKDLGSKPAIDTIRLPTVSARQLAFRAAIPVGETIAGNYDLVFLQRGRSITILKLFVLNAPATFEQELTAKLASRLR